MGGGYSGCVIGLLGVKSNSVVTFPDKKAFAIRAHATLSEKCNYYAKLYMNQICKCELCMMMKSS